MIRENDEVVKFVSENGDMLTLRQIGYSVRYEQTAVEKIENGYIVAETKYKRESGR